MDDPDLDIGVRAVSERRFDDAIKCFLKCIERAAEPVGKSYYQVFLAKTYALSGEHDLAKRTFESAKAIDSSPVSCLNYSKYLYEHGKIAEATAVLDETEKLCFKCDPAQDRSKYYSQEIAELKKRIRDL